MKLLIVNYDFPPNAGIGGRRWAKLAKGLAQAGHDIIVLKAEPLRDQIQSPWSSDVIHERIQVIDIPRGYPLIMQRPVQGWWDRIAYRLARRKLERSAPGTIYDISLGWTRGLHHALDEVHRQHKIDWILSTGAPWNMLYDIAQWCKGHATARWLVDFRDPWINARNYGMANLQGARLDWEKHKQMQVLETADVVTSPYPYLTNTLRQFAPKSGARFEVIPHFYDQEDVPQPQQNEHSSTLRLVYGGEMYVECDSQLQWLHDQLVLLRDNHPALYERLRIDFYSPTNRSDRFVGLDIVRFHAPIGKAIFERFQQADGLLLLLTPSKKDDLTTKFFEYLPLEKPLVAMGVEGEVTQFVRSQQLGEVWTSELSFAEWCSSLDRIKSDHTKASFDYSQYELGQVTKQLLTLLQ